MSNGRPLSSKERKELEKQRKQSAKQAQNYHKQQKKQQAKKSSAKNKKTDNSKKSSGKLEQLINSETQKQNGYEKISREEKFIRESDRKIRNLEPHDFEDGYYIDEYRERERQKQRAKVIRKQETEVIRRNKKPLTQKQIKRRRILISVALFAVVIIIGAILSLTVLFKTEKIDVEGDEFYYDEQIIAFSNVTLQQNIFIGALNSTAQNIVDNLPYVEKAEIGFSIPDTITIKITDAVPSYVIKSDDKYLIVSQKGRILDWADENTDNLPQLSCGELTASDIGSYVSFSDDNVPEILSDITESLRNNEVENITEFDVTDTANITLNYDNRIKINIGLPEDIDYKIRTAMKIITEKLDPNNTETVTGTLDVSTCNTTKTSHYKPETATVEATTTATEETTAPAEDYGNYSYSADTDTGGYSYGGDADTGGYSYGGDADTGGYSYGGDADTGGYSYGGDTYYGGENANGGYAEAPQY